MLLRAPCFQCYIKSFTRLFGKKEESERRDQMKQDIKSFNLSTMDERKAQRQMGIRAKRQAVPYRRIDHIPIVAAMQKLPASRSACSDISRREHLVA